MTPLVSAVIPTRNRPQLVVRAVGSVLSQTYAAVEAIVVIDGPDPATEAALEDLNDSRVRIVRLGQSAGAAEARNLGVGHAAGEWVAFLDDDDEWLPEKLTLQMRLALSAPCQFPVISCRLLARTPTREYVWPRRLPNPGEPVSEYILARRGLFQGEGVVSTITLLARRELLLRVRFEPRQRRHQEWDWIFRASHLPGFDLVFVDQPLCIWHMEEGRPSISTMSDWQYSREWIERIRPLITPRAYAAFLLTVVTALAARSGSRWNCLSLVREAVARGKPAAIDLLLFMGIVAIPEDSRRRLRALLSH